MKKANSTECEAGHTGSLRSRKAVLQTSCMKRYDARARINVHKTDSKSMARFQQNVGAAGGPPVQKAATAFMSPREFPSSSAAVQPRYTVE